MEFYGETTTEGPAADWPAIQAAAAQYERFIVRVEKYDEQKEISLKQYAYLHAVVFPILAEAIGCSLWEAEYQCKRWCGQQWELIKNVGKGMWVECSKTKLTTKQCTLWIENIMDWAAKRDIVIPPPDPQWRTNSVAPQADVDRDAPEPETVTRTENGEGVTDDARPADKDGVFEAA